MHKVVFCIGTRPDIIKMWPVIMQFKRDFKYSVIVVHSMQHAFSLGDDFDETITYRFERLHHECLITDMLSHYLKNYTTVINKERPDLLFVHGDTTTALAASLAAYYQNTPVVHIEAGLRTYQNEPFPEEFHRRLITHSATYFICPTNSERDNLLNEKLERKKLFVSGSTVVDMLQLTINNDHVYNMHILNDLKNQQNIIVTIHRREKTVEEINHICASILDFAANNANYNVLWVSHFNSHLREIVSNCVNQTSGIHILDPLCVSDMHNLLANATMLITDSGGLQEEAFFLHIPTIIVRKVSERMAFTFENTYYVKPMHFSAVIIEDYLLKSNKFQNDLRLNEYENSSKKILNIVEGILNEKQLE